MTISASTNKQTFAGNGSTTVFNSSFKIFDDDDIKVELINDTTDAVTVQTKDTHYTVSVVSSPSSAVNITMITAPASGETLVLRRVQPHLQSTDYVENDNFPAQTHENNLDKLTMIGQEHREELDRALKLNPSQSLSTYLPTLSGNSGKAITVTTAETGFEYTSVADLSLDIVGLDTETAIDAADSLAFYDATATSNKKITFANFEATLSHDSLADFLANEHIDWTSTTRNLSTSGTAATGALAVTGNITVTGTVDGRDIATDGTKLDGIEASATADQTGAEIKTAYEAEADTNAFTDADHSKLDGIETGADVTDATNVDAAGAVMNSDTSTAAMSFVIDEDNMASDSATKVPTQQSVKAYVDASGGGAGDMVLADIQTVTGAKTFNSGKLIHAGSTSGTTTVQATAVAGTTTLTLPAATDTLVGKATTDTLTNKTINTASNTITINEADIADLGSYITASSTDSLTNKTINTASNTITINEADIADLGSYITASSTDTLTNKTFDANGTGNSLSNVDVADLANGTDGELITWDAAGAPATVSVGTSGHVLTSNGAGAAPTFQAAAAGGAYTVLASGSLSSAASLDIESLITSTYDEYILQVSSLVTSVDAVDLFIRTSTNNGTGYDSSAGDYAWMNLGRLTTNDLEAHSTSATEINMNNNAVAGVGNDTGESISLCVKLHDPLNTSMKTMVEFTLLNVKGGTPASMYIHGMGHRNSNADVDAFQLIAASGNLTSGDYVFLGRANS